MSSIAICDVPVTELAWRLTRDYSTIRNQAIARARAAQKARDKNVDAAQTDRWSRLNKQAKEAEFDARAARFVLQSLIAAHQNLDEAALRAWLLERTKQFDWRAEYRKHSQ